MNFVLYFLLLLALSAGYYMYNWQTQTAAGFQAQEAAWPGRLAKLTAVNQALRDTVTAERNDLARLTTDLAEARRENAMAAIKPVPGPASGPAPMTPPESNTNGLGTVTTILGQTYHDCHLLKVEASDIVVSTNLGILQIPYVNMPPDLQKRFGFDPQAAAPLTDEQIRYQEQVRQANGP